MCEEILSYGTGDTSGTEHSTEKPQDNEDHITEYNDILEFENDNNSCIENSDSLIASESGQFVQVVALEAYEI